MDTRNGGHPPAAIQEGEASMNGDYFPPFLYFSLGAWLFLFVFFVAFCIYLWRLPDDRILYYKAKAIEMKKKLGIKIFKF
jgi:hypothetical protein